MQGLTKSVYLGVLVFLKLKGEEIDARQGLAKEVIVCMTGPLKERYNPWPGNPSWARA